MTDWVAQYQKEKYAGEAQKGGPGSGHHGHAGRPGKRGGSLPGKDGGRATHYTYWDDNANVIAANVARDIRKAIAERPGRATHGYTATNAFWLADGEVYQYNKHSTIPRDKRHAAISVHSHSAENWDEWEKRTGKKEPFQPLNSEDVRIWISMLKKRQCGPVDVIIMADGRMEILAVTSDTKPGLFKIGKVRAHRALDVDNAERTAHFNEYVKKHGSKEGYDHSEPARIRLREFAKEYDLLYLEELNWKDG